MGQVDNAAKEPCDLCGGDGHGVILWGRVIGLALMLGGIVMFIMDVTFAAETTCSSWGARE